MRPISIGFCSSFGLAATIMTTCLRFESTSLLLKWYSVDIDIGAEGNEIILLPLRKMPSTFFFSMNSIVCLTGQEHQSFSQFQT